MKEGGRAVIRMESVSGEERMEVTVPGEAQLADPAVVLRWRERLSEDDGLSPETAVTLRARPGHAMMQRRGPWAVSMVFEPGASRESAYHTPYGDLPITVAAEAVDVAFTPEGGQVDIAYGLVIQGGQTERRSMNIVWRWADADPGQA